jgi:hypothetical protein
MPRGKPKRSTPQKHKSLPPPGRWKSWSQNSDDGRLLQALLHSKSIDGMMASKLQSIYPAFAAYEQSSFRMALKRMRDAQNMTYMNEMGGKY